MQYLITFFKNLFEITTFFEDTLNDPSLNILFVRINTNRVIISIEDL